MKNVAENVSILVQVGTWDRKSHYFSSVEFEDPQNVEPRELQGLSPVSDGNALGTWLPTGGRRSDSCPKPGIGALGQSRAAVKLSLGSATMCL